MEEDYDDEPVIVENRLSSGFQNGLSVGGVQLASEENHYHYGSGITNNQPTNAQSDTPHTVSHKRRRPTPMLENNTFREDEHNPSMMYNYDGDYDARSIFSEGSYFEDQHGTLTEVLGYCQAMYDIVQRLDKKMDMLQRKVSEIRHNQIKPHFKPKPMGFPAKGPHLLSHRKIRLHKSPRVPSSHMRPASQQPYNHSLRMRAEDRTLCHPAVLRSVPSVPLSREPEQCVQRQSPPLPTIISTHSFQPPISVINARTAENRPPQTVLESYSKNDCVSYQIVNESLTSIPATLTTPEANARETDNSNLLDVPLHRSLRSDSPPTSSVPADSSYAYLGNPKRNVSIPGGCLMKARKKTKPLYAARYLLRILSYKEISNCGLEGSDEPGAKILDSNKISAVREFLALHFPSYDLGESGKDWIMCLNSVSNLNHSLKAETTAAVTRTNPSPSNCVFHETTICVDSDAEDKEPDNIDLPQKASSSEMKTAVVLLKDNQASDASPLASSESYQSSDDMDYFGARSRNIMLPAMVMFKGKQKVRPELSARYFIKHLFTDDVLIQSNVFGNPDRGVLPLDPNKIGALREFLQENYDTFDLNETGQDWRLCVAGINSTIRSIRYERKVEVKKITNKSRKRIATVTSS